MTGTTETRPDTREMVVVHDMFRREFGELPALVRGVPAGDTARAGVVVDFVDELANGLHHHHTGEDELMWPLLLERDRADSALVLRMEEQHGRIADLHDRVVAQAAEFRRAADPVTGEALAATLARLHAALVEHLAEEEAEILPIVERVMSPSEWEALGERGRAGLSKDRLLIQLGYLLHGTSPADRSMFLAKLPFPARVAWWLVGRRQFASHYTVVHGRAPGS
jgi:iron-sulfur cluster repair protein YtfE (RIC family)